MSASEIHVRAAVAADAGTAARLQEQSATEMGADPAPGFRGEYARAWTAALGQRPTWLAERDGEVVGMIVLVVVDQLPWPGHGTRRWAHVSQVYVDPAERDRGVGRLLLDTMLDWAAAHDVHRVQLNANPDSARLYRRVGFAPPPPRLLELRLPRTSGPTA